MLAEFKPGDRVYVIDPGLAKLRAIMRSAGYEPFPNHHGTVHELWDNDMVFIFFDSEAGPGLGVGAPYPLAEVRHLLPGEEG